MPPLIPWVPQEWLTLELMAASAAAALLVALPLLVCLYVACLVRGRLEALELLR